jgi:hypothetical protein
MKNISKYLIVLGLALSLVGCVMDDDERLLQEEEESLLEEEFLLEGAGEQTSAVASEVTADLIEMEGGDYSTTSGHRVSPKDSVDFAACGQTGPNWTNKITTNAAYPNAANQRSGSSTSCVALGVLQPTDDALYYCYTGASDGTWTYLKNLRTGVRGWVRDDLLRDNGSYDPCW